jgi:hypothetical protein
LSKRSKKFDVTEMLTVYTPGADGRSTVFLGHLVMRERDGVAAFDAQTRCIGIFPNQSSAADALAKEAADLTTPTFLRRESAA